MGRDSQIINVDLSHLGKYLKVFNSDSFNVLEIERLKQEDPINWKENYLNKT